MQICGFTDARGQCTKPFHAAILEASASQPFPLSPYAIPSHGKDACWAVPQTMC